MYEPSEVTALMVRTLARYGKLGEADIAAIGELPMTIRDMGAGDYLAREAHRPVCCAFLVHGYAFRQKLTITGERQIVSLHLAGDFLDLQNLFLTVADHNLQALTSGTVAEVPVTLLQKLTIDCPAIGRALWTASLVEASIGREWLLNVGRRSARIRLTHLLCEIAARLDATGAPAGPSYELPMTQEQLADALGLTSVHVNRVLKLLQKAGLITRNRRRVVVTDWRQLRAFADFNERYLHLKNRDRAATDE